MLYKSIIDTAPITRSASGVKLPQRHTKTSKHFKIKYLVSYNKSAQSTL